MKIFIYNVNNKNEFLEELDVESLESYNGCSTTIKYPMTIHGFVRCFDPNTNTWGDEIIDHRGKRIYDKNNSLHNKVFRDIGEIPENFTLIPPPEVNSNFVWDYDRCYWKKIIIEKPLVKYSKLSIYRKLKELGKWSEIKEIMIDADAYDEWELCTYLQSDDVLFNQLVSILKEKYPELDIDCMLMDCIY